MIDSVEMIGFFTEFTLRSFTPFRMTLRGVYPERNEWAQGDKAKGLEMTDILIPSLRQPRWGRSENSFGDRPYFIIFEGTKAKRLGPSPQLIILLQHEVQIGGFDRLSSFLKDLPEESTGQFVLLFR